MKWAFVLQPMRSCTCTSFTVAALVVCFVLFCFDTVGDAGGLHSNSEKRTLLETCNNATFAVGDTEPPLVLAKSRLTQWSSD